MGIINIVTRTIEKYSKPKIKPKEAKPIPPRAVGPPVHIPIAVFEHGDVLVALQEEEFPEPVQAPPGGWIVHLEDVEVRDGVGDGIARIEFARRAMVGGLRDLQTEDVDILLAVHRDMVPDPDRFIGDLFGALLAGQDHDATAVRL